MRQMKSSNTTWLGDIPEIWEISRIGSVYTLRNTKVSDRDYEPLSVTMNGVVPQLESAAKTNAHDDRKLVKKGDFAINSRSDRRGSCGIADRDGSVSLINTILRPNGEMNPRYYNWLFHTAQFADEFYANGHGIVDDLWTTGWQEMKRILIPLPPLPIQESIANFLDLNCSEIDSLSTDIQSQIDILEEYKKAVITETVTKGLNPNVEMKDSGIEWIGIVPQNWDVKKIKYVTKQRNEKALYNPETDFYVGLENIKSYSDILIETETEYEKSVQDIFKTGDVLFNKLRPYLSKVWLANINGFCTGELLNFKSFNGNKKFLFYALLNKSFIDIVNASTYGAKMPRANSEFIINLPICIPPRNEQDAIVEYLDTKCAEIDAVIADKKAQLETLTEYKKSLIYEYVTGKKEVPENV